MQRSSIGQLLAATLIVIWLSGCSSAPAPSPQQVEPLPVKPSQLEQIERRYGPMAAARVRHWQQLIADNQDKTEQEKLRLVNHFFNGALFVSDQTVWEQNDYWATPVEFLILDAGDCEDFACAKYFTLLKLAVPMEKLRLIYCRTDKVVVDSSRAHIVVAYYETPGSIPLILDNINPKVLESTQRLDLKPVFSFNGSDMWVARTRDRHVKGGKPEQLKRWVMWQERSEQTEVPVLVIRKFR